MEGFVKRIFSPSALLLLIFSLVSFGQEPGGGVITDLVFFDDQINAPLTEFTYWGIGNFGPTSAQVKNGTASLGGDWDSWAGLIPRTVNRDTSVFWVQPTSRVQFWTRATVANQRLRIFIQPVNRSLMLIRDYFLPGPNADTWYFVDIPLDSTFRNLPMTGLQITGDVAFHTRYFDDLKITNVRLYAGPGEPQPAPMNHIAASQIGYAPNMRKLFSSPVDFTSFQIVRVSDAAVVYTGGPSVNRITSTVINGTNVWVGDFTSVTVPGRYKIVAGGRESYPFNIGTDVFDQPVRAAQRMLYYQRQFTAITMPYAEGPWVHVSTAPIAPPGVEGGWQEAGNYPIQLALVAQTLQHLLSAWEDFRPMSDTTNIPESGNGIPDILDEARWGLRSVLTMQDTSGGFWTTVCPNNGVEGYPYGTNPPLHGTRPEDLTQFVKILIATPATAKAIAVLAYASVVYREFDLAFANQCLAAAQHGWTWLQNHAEITDENLPCIAASTGGDPVAMASQRMWAAAGMLYATGDPQYNSAFEANYVNINWIPSYNQTQAYAGRLYLRSPVGLPARKSIVLSQMSALASNAVGAGIAHPFGVSIAYYWGSLNNSLQSSGNYNWKFYLDDHSRTADLNQSLENIHYVFGRNILNICYVSGLIGATNARVEGFHVWLKSIHVTPFSYPGILAGGPSADPDPNDVTWPPYLYGYYGDSRFPRDASTPIDGRFTDNDSWSTNEPTIGWNAVLVYNLYAAQAVAKNQFVANTDPYARANIKVLLGGAYNATTGLMATSLKTTGALTNHFPTTVIPANAVDSINIEIRNAPTAAAAGLRLYQPAWLLSDGTIRSFADTSKAYIEFPTPAGNYYLVVRHRNHLPIMSAPAQSLSPATPAAYDFTTSQSSAYGVNPMQQVGSKFALYPGDSNASGNISVADANAVLGQLNVLGYNIHDINLSGIVSAADANIIFGNVNKLSRVP